MIDFKTMFGGAAFDKLMKGLNPKQRNHSWRHHMLTAKRKRSAKARRRRTVRRDTLQSKRSH